MFEISAQRETNMVVIVENPGAELLRRRMPRRPRAGRVASRKLERIRFIYTLKS